MAAEISNVTMRMQKKQADEIKKMHSDLEGNEASLQSFYKNLVAYSIDMIEKGEVDPMTIINYNEKKEIENLVAFTNEAISGKGPIWRPLVDIFEFNSNLKKVYKLIKTNRPHLNELGFKKVRYFIGKEGTQTIIRVFEEEE